MNVIVTDAGFAPDDHRTFYDVASDVDPVTLHTQVLDMPAIAVGFPTSADGRGFTIAAQLRRMGYTGRLRARGHILADQYAMARRSGFDEVEIGDELALRQPEPQWLARANWRAHDYQSRLRRA